MLKWLVTITHEILVLNADDETDAIRAALDLAEDMSAIEASMIMTASAECLSEETIH